MLHAGLYISFLSIYSLVTFLNDKTRNVAALWCQSDMSGEAVGCGQKRQIPKVQRVLALHELGLTDPVARRGRKGVASLLCVE